MERCRASAFRRSRPVAARASLAAPRRRAGHSAGRSSNRRAGRCDHRSRRTASIIVTARRREERLVDVPIAVTSFSGAQLAERGAHRHHRYRPDRAQRHAGSLARHQLDAVRLHPRHRPAGSGLRLRAGRRHLSRRRLSQPPAGRGARHLRRRAHRGAARAAGHALRPQHHRRRGQICDHASCPTIPRSSSRATYGTYDQADGVVTASAPIGDDVRVGGIARAPLARRLRHEPDHRPGKLQQGHLGRARHARTGRPWRALS